MNMENLRFFLFVVVNLIQKMYNNLKLFVIASSVLGISLFSSCNKEDDASPGSIKYYFNAKLNGKQYDLLHDAQFQGGGNDNKWQHIVIAGYEKDYDPSKPIEQWTPGFGLELWNEGGDLQPNTYSYIGGGPYDDENPKSYSADGEYHIQTKDHTIVYDAHDSRDFTITITEISKVNGIKGKFKGLLTNQSNFSDKLIVTDGEFYLPFEGECKINCVIG